MKDRGESELVETCGECGVYRGMWSPCGFSRMPQLESDRACKRAVPEGFLLIWDERRGRR